jgi:hypothetical protein
MDICAHSIVETATIPRIEGIRTLSAEELDVSGGAIISIAIVTIA